MKLSKISIMAYRWKPSKAQKSAYAEKMREAEEEYSFIRPNGALRVGCYVQYVDKRTNIIVQGTITKSTYRSDGQHSLTLDCKKTVMGRNIYDRLLSHSQGEISIKESR